jgi:hypothetical protein
VHQVFNESKDKKAASKQCNDKEGMQGCIAKRIKEQTNREKYKNRDRNRNMRPG